MPLTRHKRNMRVFHQMDIGSDREASSIANRARENPRRNYLANDFEFIDEKKYLAENAKYGAEPFPPNLHFSKGGALTAIRRLKLEGKKTKKIVIAMGVGNLLNPRYLGFIAKHAKEVLTREGVIYFVSTWPPKEFKREIVPFFKKEGYVFRQLSRNIDRQSSYSGKAASWHMEYGAVQWEYTFSIKGAKRHEPI